MPNPPCGNGMAIDCPILPIYAISILRSRTNRLSLRELRYNLAHVKIFRVNFRHRRPFLITMEVSPPRKKFPARHQCLTGEWLMPNPKRYDEFVDLLQRGTGSILAYI